MCLFCDLISFRDIIQFLSTSAKKIAAQFSLISYSKHISVGELTSLVICVSYVGIRITSGMYGMVTLFIHGISFRYVFNGLGNTWDLCSFWGLGGEYISLGICVPG